MPAPCVSNIGRIPRRDIGDRIVQKWCCFFPCEKFERDVDKNDQNCLCDRDEHIPIRGSGTDSARQHLMEYCDGKKNIDDAMQRLPFFTPEDAQCDIVRREPQRQHQRIGDKTKKNKRGICEKIISDHPCGINRIADAVYGRKARHQNAALPPQSHQKAQEPHTKNLRQGTQKKNEKQNGNRGIAEVATQLRKKEAAQTGVCRDENSRLDASDILCKKITAKIMDAKAHHNENIQALEK